MTTMRVDVKEAADFLRSRDNFLILMHANPDGDTLGCGFSLCGALQRIGKNAKAVCPDEIPQKFDYMFRAVKPQEFEHETVVCVDVADTKLLGDMKAVGDKAALCIDHHGTNVEYAERLLVRADYASACELMYEVIKALGVEVDVNLANCIYTGIATDTGCFKFSNTSVNTHLVAAEMLRCGAEYAMINYLHFEMKTQGRLKIEQEVLNNIRYYADGRIAVITVPLALADSVPDIDSDDLGALSDIPRRIKGVDVGISVKERKPGFFKASLRTSELVSASEICARFGGGGHIRAAGCSFPDVDSMEQAVELIVKASVEAVEKALKK